MNHIMKYRVMYASTVCGIVGMIFLIYGHTDEHIFGSLLAGLAIGRLMGLDSNKESSSSIG